MTATAELVGRLRGLYAKATAAPWYAKEPGEDGSVYIDADEDGDYPVAMIMSGSPHNRDIADGALITEAVNALPTLLTTIETLSAALAEAEEARDLFRTQAINRGWNWQRAKDFGSDEAYRRHLESEIDITHKNMVEVAARQALSRDGGGDG